MKTAIAIISFNRPRYLEEVLRSLLLNDLTGSSVYCFQDGHVTKSGIEVAKEKDIEENIALFKSYFPNGTLYVSPYNLGVALHFDKIETLLFEVEKYDRVIFLEDDLVLQPNYISVLKLMFDMFGDDGRVGMISAYGAKTDNSLENQRNNNKKLAQMRHNWGFGLTRQWWEKRQPFVREYLEKFMIGKEYRKRDSVGIRNWILKKGEESETIKTYFEKRDIANYPTSQDGIKNLSTLNNKAVRITCYPNLAKYIGKEGLHCNPEIFKRNGFEEQVVFTEKIENIEVLSEELYDKFFNSHFK